MSRGQMRWMTLAVLLVLASAMGLMACGGTEGNGDEGAATAAPTETSGGETTAPASDNTKRNVAFISIYATGTGEARAMKAFESSAKEVGWDVQLADGGYDFQKIGSLMETFINQGVDALVLGAIDPSVLGDYIKKANDAKIPVVVESGLWGEGVDLQVGMDSFHMGEIQGSYTTERLGQKGQVLMLTTTAARNVEMRAQVFQAIIGQFPAIELLEKHEVDTTNPIEDARKTVETTLLRNPGLDMIWGGWDDLCTGAATAVSAAGRDDIFMIGNDGGEEALAQIRDPQSPWDVTVYVDYATIGSTLVTELQKIFAGETLPYKNVYVDLPLVTRDNAPPEGEPMPTVDTYTAESAD